MALLYGIPASFAGGELDRWESDVLDDTAVDT